ncbi:MULTISPECIES: amino acid permease [unclassified Sphingomonas]|uniref:amino acid permease n=1 Tax=unclassified Sphingomonas TaxID=196159 RepID=UPI001613AF56|nr:MULTISPECIES: amino acid permease [unclassified Sphingomonas]MBB3348971.1 APA family basic amino acid/polyamine antiporter [Sphingomonas sp. BK069]MBB3475325.1 APA family basic amino acid/polyamine antiporter [Sphingomonas sp. BK345]
MEDRDNHAEAARSSRALTFWGLLALVMGNLIGSGIYLLPATLAPLGANATLGWVVTIAGAMTLSFVFARLAAAIPRAGGPYAYADAAFGPVIGFATAWSYWTLVWAGNGAVAVAVVSALSLAFPALAPHAAIAAVVLVWLAVLVNIRGVDLAVRLQMATMVIKLVPLAAVVLLAAWLLLTRGVAVSQEVAVPLTVTGTAGAAALTFWGFLGVESATVPADRVADARRIVPRATLIGTAAVGVIYLIVSSAITALMPRATVAASPAPIAAFLGLGFGGGVAQVVALFAAISALGTLNGFVLLQGEVPRAMAQGGVFPRWFARETAQGTPARAHVVAGLLVTAVTLANFTRGMGDLFAFVASVSLAAGMLAYLASALAAVKLLRDDPVARVVGVIAAVFVGWLSYGLGAEANGWALALLLAGVPVYLAVRRGGASAR